MWLEAGTPEPEHQVLILAPLSMQLNYSEKPNNTYIVVRMNERKSVNHIYWMACTMSNITIVIDFPILWRYGGRCAGLNLLEDTGL